MIGNKLLELRNNRKCSQQELSLEIGVSQTAYYKWEKGITKPSTENLMKIASFYQISIYDIIDKINIKNTPIIFLEKTDSENILLLLMNTQIEITKIIQTVNDLLEVFIVNY